MLPGSITRVLGFIAVMASSEFTVASLTLAQKIAAMRKRAINIVARADCDVNDAEDELAARHAVERAKYDAQGEGE